MSALAHSWISIAISVSVCLVTLPWALALGADSIRCWANAKELERIRQIHFAWWLLACLASLTTVSVVGANASWGLSIFTGLWVSLLIALTKIDLVCRLLPDSLTGLLLVSGLAMHGLFFPEHFLDALLGAMLGYGFLWVLAKAFALFRNTDAMGRGDFAMAAGLGAWLGWQRLPMALLLASLVALFATLAQRRFGKTQPPQPFDTAQSTPTPKPWVREFLKAEIPFGPALALGGIGTWMQIG